MTLSQKLDIQQRQSLVLTKDLQQAIKLLQLSSQELEVYLDDVMQENPLLEYIEDESEEQVREKSETDDLDFDGPADEVEVPDIDDTDLTQLKSISNYRDDDNQQDMLENVSEVPDLRAHLTQQLYLETDIPLHRAIGVYLIDCLDENGYLRASIEELEAQLGCQRAEIEKIILLLQQFDPPGIFARSLQECLALQLKETGELDPLMTQILNHLDAVGRKDLKGLMQITGADADSIMAKIHKIKTLNPRPASDFCYAQMPASRPDLLVTRTPQKTWRVDFNPDVLPRVQVNQPYYESLQSTVSGTPDKNYVKGCYQSASWLLKAIEQRTINILKVARAIVAHQTAFFDEGINALKPLQMKEVAEITGLSESTISRVTDHKYMLTPRGLFELKFFFTTALESRYATHAAISAESVRHRIKALIESEVYPNILADDMLVILLRQEGTDIARRTVTKYREAMGISSSFVRRQQKKPFDLAI